MKRGNKPYSVTFESLVMRLVKQLSTADHRVVYRGPGFLLRLLAVRVQAAPHAPTSTAALSRCLPRNNPADADIDAPPPPRPTHQATTTMTPTTTTLTWTTMKSQRSWPKKPDDGLCNGLPVPGTGPGIPSEWPPRNDAIGLDIQRKWPPRDGAIGRSIGRSILRPRDDTITRMWNRAGTMKDNAANRNTDGRGGRNIERKCERPP